MYSNVSYLGVPMSAPADAMFPFVAVCAVLIISGVLIPAPADVVTPFVTGVIVRRRMAPTPTRGTD